MLALVKTKPGPGAQVVEMRKPRPGEGEALIKIHRASICGSDLSIFNWTTWAPSRVKTPRIFGHEVCGEIIELGKGAKRFKEGDKVAVESHLFCGKCVSCLNGDRHICRKMLLLGFDLDGGFAQYAALPEKVLWKFGAQVPYNWASLMEPVGNALYAVTVEPVEGKTVVVLGCGPQGLSAVQIAKAKGASLVVAVEKSPFRAKLAKKLGAHYVFGPECAGEGELKEKLLSIKQAKEGYDVCLEMSGAAPLSLMAFQVLRNGGRLSLFGLTSGKTGIDIGEDIIFKGLRIYGIIGRRLFETWEELDFLVSYGKFDLNSIVTHVFPLKDALEAFRLFSAPQKESGKIVLEVS
ncbi:MAG: alcohol dehydrogenase catalytic domain-containing protein [Elusimicrobia bacterium]|nr:alcohol dehydrogenase catalytic domain-containing protein [Elusimicrobiota bacterium]